MLETNKNFCSPTPINSFVSSVVGVLLVWGTLLELYLARRLRRANRRRREKCTKVMVVGSADSTSDIVGCTTYDLTMAAPPNKSDLPIGIVIPHRMQTNGSSGVAGGINSGMNNNDSDENLAATEASTVSMPSSMAATASITTDAGADGAVVSADERFGLCTELLLSFSVITNFRAICDRSIGSDSISCIHGLRAISMAWVILGHTCIIIFKYSDNMELRKVVEKRFMFQTVTNGAYSVDTFFFMSGFLVSYIYFRTNAKGKLEKLTKGVSEVTAGTLHFFGLLMYRFIR